MGHQTLAQAQDILRLCANLGSRKAGPVAEVLVNVGAIASVQRALLPDALARFHKQAQGCRTHVVPGLSMHLVDQVDAGEIDMAVVIRPPFSLQGDLHWTTLAHEPFRLLVPRQLRGSDWAGLLSTQPFIRYDRASFGGRQVERFLRAAHIQVQEVCELDELEAIVRLVANKVGIALLPQTADHKRWPPDVRAVSLGDRTFHRDIGLLHRPSHTLSEPARILAKLICAAYGRSGS
jgi:DNA-binding transcriptional LysR family regulator